MTGATVRSNWRATVLVCGKCSKRLDGGFGPRQRLPLAKALRKHLGLKKGRKAAIGIVETKCLGVCPRGAVTVVNPAHADDWFIVKSGSDLADVAAGLGLVPSGAAGDDPDPSLQPA